MVDLTIIGTEEFSSATLEGVEEKEERVRKSAAGEEKGMKRNLPSCSREGKGRERFNRDSLG